MKRLGLLFVLLSALLRAATPATPAAPLKPAGQAIEHNLSYLRVHALPADLPAAPAIFGTLVLDLRFVSAGSEAATALASWLQARARPQAPVIVLVNRGTSSTLLASLVPSRMPAGAISLGLATPGFSPDVALSVDTDADHTAYEAFEHGLSVDELINPKMDKVRHDEAAMAKERAAGNVSDGDEEPLLPAASEKPKPAPAPATPIDQVLQRAVQLHHALVALRKIP